MSERAALVAAVASAPADDLPKFVFADWLDENGEPERAEFVRLQIAARREAEQFPPVIDKAKLSRIYDLFFAHYRVWLRPVYEALGQRLPTFNFSASPRDSLDVASSELAYTHRGEPGPLRKAVFRDGFMEAVHLDTWRVGTDAFLADTFAAEPITDVYLRMWRSGVWPRIDGPHLRRVRSLRPALSNMMTDEAATEAEAVCGSEHLTGLRSLSVTPDDLYDGAMGEAVMFDALRRSPLRLQLITLELTGVDRLTAFLSEDTAGFDALRELSVVHTVPPGEADLFGGEVSATFRRQLEALNVFTPVAGVTWLVSGPGWERLERLTLRQTGLGAREIGALGHSDILPALSELRLTDYDLTDSGVIAFARSPLVERLRVLEVGGRQLGDEAVRALAGSLDRGLGFLSVPVPQPLRAELFRRYGPRLAFSG